MTKIMDFIDCVYIDKYYYMINKTGEIQILDDNLEFIDKIERDIKYSSLTYNNIENWFYFSESGNRKQIHQDSNTFEVDYVIDLPANLLSEIKDLSYCSDYKRMLITTEKKVSIFNLENNRLKDVYEVKEQEDCGLHDCTRPLSCENNNRMILMGAFFCCKDIYIAYRMCGVSYICKLIDGELKEIVYSSRYLVMSTFQKNNEIFALIDKDTYQEIVSTGIDCLYDCEDETDSDCQIIKSIALVERNIAKILDSEASKIQATISRTDNITDLLCVNDSVNELVYYVTILEFILTEKLKAVKKKDCGFE